MCSRRHGEVVLEVRRLQKTVISSYQQKRNRRITAQQVANQFLAASGKQRSSEKLFARRLRGKRTIRTQTCCVCLIEQDSTVLPVCNGVVSILRWTEQDWKGPISDMQYHGVGRHHDQWPHAPTCGGEWDYDGPTIHIDEVLLPHVRLFRVAVGDKFVLWTTTQHVIEHSLFRIA
ncbi:hypothetical protein TNCV_5092931 [Trichonephila clavipes]|nr:hypothetical protein TNCV_5092931 [Trichonephila clavipes]